MDTTPLERDRLHTAARDYRAVEALHDVTQELRLLLVADGVEFVHEVGHGARLRGEALRRLDTPGVPDVPVGLVEETIGAARGMVLRAREYRAARTYTRTHQEDPS